MNELPSSELLIRFREQDPAAAEELFRRYVERLIGLARSRLSRRLAARVDAEDVVQSAYRSFFLLAREGTIVVHARGDLWRLLVRITLRKVYRTARRHQASRRSIHREIDPEPGIHSVEQQALAPEPTPAEAAALTETVRSVLAPLPPLHRQIVQLFLQGHDTEEIARQLQRSARTIRRTLSAFSADLEERLREPQAEHGSIPDLTEGNALIPYSEIVLHQQVGEGGMGKVYRARWLRSKAEVAVKLIRKPLREHERTISRFQQEAVLLTRFRHPGIVSIHGLGALPDGGLFLVMDLIVGSDLARQVATGPIELRRALRWIDECAQAIDHAHQQQIIHCDLKPGNLLLDLDDHVHVTDFGLARCLTEACLLPEAGTPGFLAPEQIDPRKGSLSPRTDVHGLGAVLYTLLAGRPPYPPPSRSRAEPTKRRSITPLHTLRPDIPKAVAEFCQHCLARNPARRPSTAADVAAEVRSLLERISN